MDLAISSIMARPSSLDVMYMVPSNFTLKGYLPCSSFVNPLSESARARRSMTYLWPMYSSLVICANWRLRLMLYLYDSNPFFSDASIWYCLVSLFSTIVVLSPVAEASSSWNISDSSSVSLFPSSKRLPLKLESVICSIIRCLAKMSPYFLASVERSLTYRYTGTLLSRNCFENSLPCRATLPVFCIMPLGVQFTSSIWAAQALFCTLTPVPSFCVEPSTTRTSPSLTLSKKEARSFSLTVLMSTISLAGMP